MLNSPLQSWQEEVGSDLVDRLLLIWGVGVGEWVGVRGSPRWLLGKGPNLARVPE